MPRRTVPKTGTNGKPATAPIFNLTAAHVRMLAQASLNTAERDFQISGNPVHLLHAMESAEAARLPFPPWVTKALAEASKQADSKKSPLALDQALGFQRGQGMPSRWKEYETYEKDQRLKWLIEEQKQQYQAKHPGKKLTDEKACEQVATLLYENGENCNAETLLYRYQHTLKTLPSRFTR